MFGQTAGIGSTSISSSSKSNISEKATESTYVKNLNTPTKKIVKVVDFEKEKKSEAKKIKIKTF